MNTDVSASQPDTAGARLRNLIGADGTLLLPGVFDALSARLAMSAGFGALYMSGFSVSASRAALPDDGLLTMTEMADEAAAIVSATGLPVLADADTGYGDVAGITRAIRRYERAGVGGVHIEDLAYPKRGLDVVTRDEMLVRLEAALTARTDPSFVIVGRTDSLDTLGLDEAIARALMLEAAGVDAVFVHSLTRRVDFERVRAEVQAPLIANLVEGVTELTNKAEVDALGYDIALFPISVLRGVMKTALDLYGELLQHGRLSSSSDGLIPFDSLQAVLGLQTAL